MYTTCVSFEYPFSRFTTALMGALFGGLDMLAFCGRPLATFYGVHVGQRKGARLCTMTECDVFPACSPRWARFLLGVVDAG